MLFILPALCGVARAQTITEFPVPSPTSGPDSITAGPDGAMWFAETKSGLQKFGRITTAGAITEFPFATGRPLWPRGIVSGPDGALWFTVWAGNAENNLDKIGRITTAGVVSLFDIGTFALPLGITAGPDGALWFAKPGDAKIGRITTSGAVTEFPIPSPDTNATGIAAGSDGALWFSVPSTTGFPGGNKIGRMTTSGALTLFPIPTADSVPMGIAAGPDGALWFCENKGNKIGRITTSGAITEFPLLTSGAGPSQIAAGPDGALWFTENLVGKIGRITTAGVVTEFTIPSFFTGPEGIAAGPDGAMWFAEQTGNRIGRITTSGGGGTPVLTISKSAPASVASGQNLTYTITYGNSGTAPATGVIISDNVPSGTNFVSATNGGVVSAGAVTWNLGTLNNGVTGQTVSFTVGVTATSGSVTNSTYSIQSSTVSPVFGSPVSTTVTGGGGGNAPNLTPYQPTGWSDKIVVAKTTGTKTDASQLSPADTLYVSWAVINNGTAPTTVRFFTEMYIDGTLTNSWFTDPPLNATFYSYVEDFSIGSLAAGTHTIRIKADSTNAIAETSETDNEYTKTITVAAATESIAGTVAVVVSSPGVGSSLFKTGFQMHNSTALPQSGRLVFHLQGTSGSATDSSLAFSLAPGQTQSIDDLLPAMGLTGAQIGSLDFLMSAGAPAPVVAARVFNDAGAAGTTGFTMGAASSDSILNAGDRGVLFAPADIGRFRMNVGVRSGPSGAAMTVTRRNAAGAVVQTLTKTYAPNFFEQIGATAFLAGAPFGANDSITIQVTSGSAIVYGVNADNTTQDPAIQFATKAP